MTDEVNLSKEEMVAEFYRAAGVDPSAELCVKLIEEELLEVREAAQHLLKELADLEYVLYGSIVCGYNKEIPQELVAEVMRTGTRVSEICHAEWADEAFERVHQSNMSKLTNGVMVRDLDTGKILKGHNYQPPDFSDII